jgi:hypothetical protein
MSNSSSRGAVSIDKHHHFNQTFKDNEGNPWPVQMALDELDRNGIASAIASLGPVNGSNSDERRGQERDWNEWGGRICLEHPGRFDPLATQPLPDTDLALSEITHAYDVRHADGAGFPTSDGGFWLGDKRNAPVFRRT